MLLFCGPGDEVLSLATCLGSGEKAVRSRFSFGVELISRVCNTEFTGMQN